MTPTTAAGRALADRAKREAWSNWEGLAQFTIPRIEAEARADERARIEGVVRTARDDLGYRVSSDAIRAVLAAIRDEPREETNR